MYETFFNRFPKKFWKLLNKISLTVAYHIKSKTHNQKLSWNVFWCFRKLPWNIPESNYKRFHAMFFGIFSKSVAIDSWKRSQADISTYPIVIYSHSVPSDTNDNDDILIFIYTYIKLFIKISKHQIGLFLFTLNQYCMPS